jgi:hypothetical protein
MSQIDVTLPENTGNGSKFVNLAWKTASQAPKIIILPTSSSVQVAKNDTNQLPAISNPWNSLSVPVLINICGDLQVDKLNIGGGKKDSKWHTVVERLAANGIIVTPQQAKNKWCQEKITYRYALFYFR